MKTIISRIVLFCVLLMMLVSFVQPIQVSARVAAVDTNVGGISTYDKTQSTNIWIQTLKQIADWAKDRAGEAWRWLRDEGIALAYKKALAYFLNKLAQDTATYIVTGNKGQGTMFYTESWGDYIRNVGDGAMGTFLETLGKNGPVKFNLCNPGLPVTMSIGIGLLDTKLKKPACTFTEMKQRWKKELGRPDFMKRFINIYTYESNDFGIALSLQQQMIQDVAFQKEMAVLNRETNQGWKDVSEDISKAVKTPSNVVRDFTNNTISKAGNNYFVYTGHIVADAIDVFTSTLIKKLIEKWLKKGLARSYDHTAYTGDYGGFGSASKSAGVDSAMSRSASDYEADTSSSGGIKEAEKEFESFIAPNFSVKGDYNVLNELVTCMDPTDAKTSECVITDNFRQAIDSRMNVGEAAASGYINRFGVFGFKTDGLEPSYTEGIPYRSMIILRKYRIIPVGWELAAQYIMENQNQLHRTFSLTDMVACFDPNDRYVGYTDKWCQGLVDPSWVLKSPQNFCKREGAGPHIVSKQVAGEKTQSKYLVSRDTDYCGDEQSCVKENSDGSCAIYGYCIEDKRKYNFGGQTCEPKYNSCQSFRSNEGSTVSLLKNTLDYSNCNADNAGCSLYKRSTSISDSSFYDLAHDKVDWIKASSSIGLSGSAADCEKTSEGCHEFIRTQPGLGSNLLPNGGFENAQDPLAGWGQIGEAVSDSKEGGHALQLSGDLDKQIVIDPPYGLPEGKTYDLYGSIYTLSFYVKNCGSSAMVSLSGANAGMEAADDWRLVSVTKAFKDKDSGNTIRISTNGANGCDIDALKLERTTPDANGKPSVYAPYGSVGTVYEKLLPNYLYNSCYQDANNDGFIEKIKGAPASCDNYARPCTSQEVNCEMYKSAASKMQIPAVVGANDYCPASCVGFDGYLQSETSFEDSKEKFFIPSTAESCSVLAKGCDEFTNLDETDSPEAREYYIHLKRCVDAKEPTCRPFFMWEGSDESGYQLKIQHLDTANGAIATIDGASGCSIDVTSANYSPDCREFYGEDGKPFYELYYNTVTCSDQCHSYRRAAEDETKENCERHKGEWRDNSVCVYKGIPGEGVTCQAEEAGCREFNGNSGANTRILFQHSFETGTNLAWNGGVNTNASVIVGQHSLLVESSASLDLGSNLVEGRAYVLQFLASGAGSDGRIDSVYFENPTTGKRTDSMISSTSLTEVWKSYEVNLAALNHEVDSAKERLVINGKLYIDNIKLTEVVDRYYLIEESWHDNCGYEDADTSKPKWTDPGHYAGCDAYTDRVSKVHNLFQFDHLCTDEAVGCELMIDTHNSSNPELAHYDSLDVPADSYVFAVYDAKKQCADADKGCERLGLESTYSYPDMAGVYKMYENVYRLNDPDNYEKSLCSEQEAGCKEWASRNGTSYFKDPGNSVCQWRMDTGGGFGAYDWFKKSVKRCDAGDANGKIDMATNPEYGVLPIASERNLCDSAADCDVVDKEKVNNVPDFCEEDEDCPGSVCVNNECRYQCIEDKNDYHCDLDNATSSVPKTMGYGGLSAKTQQPLGALEGKVWAGECPSKQDDCTEYIDPVSSFSPLTDVLKPYTLYVLDSGVLPNCENKGKLVGLDTLTNRLNASTLISPVISVFASSSASSTGSTASSTIATTTNDLFYYMGDKDCAFNPSYTGIREALVGYEIKNTLDKNTCNGVVDLDKGCRMLNERSIDGASGYTGLKYNADEANYIIPTAPVLGPPNDANLLLKVTPDRECKSWLSCRSFIKDNKGEDVCFDIGLCQQFDENGNCVYFAPDKEQGAKKNQTYAGIGTSTAGTLTQNDISNMTGYTKVAYTSNSNPLLKNDYYSVPDMKQYGQLAKVPNGSFESYDDNLYPIGWMSPDNIDWQPDHFRVINNPVSAQLENIKYPIDGTAFLKFGAKSRVQSEPIEFAGKRTDYVLTFYANTKNLASGQLVVTASFLASPLTLENSSDWRKFVYRFTTADPNGTITFAVAPGSDGNVYIDNVKIAPVLDSRKEGNSEWYIPQDCRLYPEADALSCDYKDNSGHRKIGWPGYCLEYDRYPGKSDACLMWYPVDRINGDGYEEGGGYIEREPLYYCTAKKDYNFGIENWYENPTQNTLATEDFIIKNNLGAHTSTNEIVHQNPYKYSEDTWSLTDLGFGSIDPKWLLWENIDHIRIRHTSPEVTCDGKLSPSWDLYYRFNVDMRGGGCPESVESGDCVPWGAPRVGGWDYDRGLIEDLISCHPLGALDPTGIFVDTCEDAYDSNTEYGGIEILSTYDDAGNPVSFSGIKTSSFDSYCDHPDRYIKEIVIFPKTFYCSDVVQAVTAMGQNKYYSANVYEGTDFKVSCNDGIGYADTHVCEFNSDLAPFGAVSEPGLTDRDYSMMTNPFLWDSTKSREGKQPLFFTAPEENEKTSNVRMGQLYNEGTVLDNLFVKYYGKWEYVPNGEGGVDQVMGYYNKISGAYQVMKGNDPKVFNAATTPNSGSIYVNNLVNLTFNTDADKQQLPLTMISVNWGDGTETTLSGIEMRDRPEPKHPHSMYHIYGKPINATITIKIRDNWGKEGSQSISIRVNTAYIHN